MMSVHDVRAVLGALKEAGVQVWIDGGWGIDALIGRATRGHLDLDLAIDREHLDRAMEALGRLGFAHNPEIEPGLPARSVLRHDDGRQVDLHPLSFDESGNGMQELGNGAVGIYTAEGLTGEGDIGGVTVRCLTPELQLRHHLGYEWDENDWHDMRLLQDHFGIQLPSDPD
jgi:lincosamide nucleotidyltransferase A/C/D/E